MNDRKLWAALAGGLVLTFPLAFAAFSQSTSIDCCDPASPFREGEGFADDPATCQNMAYWADRAPKTDARISLTIKGKLSTVEWTGVVAYLVMCDAREIQVVCVTYDTNGMRRGDEVTFGGGYARHGDKRIVLDPCLASRD